MQNRQPFHPSQEALIIPADRLSDLLDVQLARPGRLSRSSLYALSSAIIMATTWAFFSVINVTVRTEGVIRPSEGLQSYPSPFTGVIDSIYVIENQSVRPGDTVLAFSSSDLEVELRQNAEDQARLFSEITDVVVLTGDHRGGLQFFNPQYRAEREMMLRELELMNIEISVAAKKSVRAQKLRAKGLVSEEEFDKIRSELELLRVRKERYSHEKRSFFQTKLSSLRQDIAKLEKNRLLLEDAKGKRIVTANARGQILQLRVQKSHVNVTSGQELFVISPDSHLTVELFVATKDIGMMKEGLKVSYLVEALPFQEWGSAGGRVQDVSKDIYVEKSGSRAYFKVVASLHERELHSRRNGKCAVLTKGMMVHAGIIVGEKRLLGSLWDKTVEYFALR
jgi:HlyD family secretion protein